MYRKGVVDKSKAARAWAASIMALSISACTSFGQQPLLRYAGDDSTASYQAMALQQECAGCVVEPHIEYIDKEIPECLQKVEVITHQPECEVCGDFAVSVRSKSGPGSCDQGGES